MIVPPPPELVPAEKLGHVHFVGIGGAGLSGIARIMLARGMSVSGSDAKDSRTLTALRALGATCHVGHDPSHVDGADTLVISTAIKETNVEVVEARRRGLLLYSRAEALSAVMDGRRVCAVSGAHGKTTTTSMLGRLCSTAVPTRRSRSAATSTITGQRPRRHRRHLRGRGRRVRRVLPAVLATSRGGHERRPRPSRLLRRRPRTTTRRSTTSPNASSPAASWSRASTTPAPAASPTPPAPVASTCAPTARPPTPTSASRNSVLHPRSSTFELVVHGRRQGRPSTSMSPGRHTLLRTPRPPTPPVSGWASRRASCAKACRYTGTRRRFEYKGRPMTFASTTTTATIRPRCWSTCGLRAQARVAEGGRVIVAFQPLRLHPHRRSSPRIRRARLVSPTRSS